MYLLQQYSFILPILQFLINTTKYFNIIFEKENINTNKFNIFC